MTNNTVRIRFEEVKLYLRQEVRKTLGIDVANMTFLRWEQRPNGLVPIKAGSKWAHVRYTGRNLNQFFNL